MLFGKSVIAVKAASAGGTLMEASVASERLGKREKGVEEGEKGGRSLGKSPRP